MTKHIIDGHHTRVEGARLKAFLKTERANRPHPSSLALQRRHRDHEVDLRPQKFARIERRSAP